jgi:hypothetical protein
MLRFVLDFCQKYVIFIRNWIILLVLLVKNTNYNVLKVILQTFDSLD